MRSEGQRALSATDCASSRVVWLLDITWASEVWLFATEPCRPRDGTTRYNYRGGLSGVTYQDVMGLFELGMPGRSATIEVVFPVSVAGLVADGYDLAGAVCELSRWVVGTDLGRRHVVLKGRAVDPEYGGLGTSARFSLKQTYADDRGLFPPSSAAVIAETSNTDLVDDFEVGLFYPWVFGRAGVVDSVTSASGSQAVWRAKSYGHELVVAGHPVTCTYVGLIPDDALVGVTYFKVTTTTDYSGRTISVIDNDNAANDTFNEGTLRYPGLYSSTMTADQQTSFRSATDDTHGIFGYWRNRDDNTQGGLPASDGSGACMRGAGDILQEILSYSTQAIDRVQMASVAASLNAFALDFSVDDQTTAWEFVAANLLPVLPVSVVGGAFGLQIIPWDANATTLDAVTHLNVDDNPGIDTAERVRVDTDQIFNHFELSYARSLRVDRCAKRLIVGAEQHQDFYASGIISLPDGFIRVRSRDAGPRGEVTIEIGTSTSNGLIDNAITRDVSVVLDNAPLPTVLVFVALLNTSTLIRAELESGDATLTVDGAIARSDASSVGVLQNLQLVLPAAYFGGGASRLCTESQRRYAGVINPDTPEAGKSPKVMESAVIYDPATAAMVIGWMEAAYSLARKSVDFAAPETQYGWLQLGHRVQITDTRLGFDAALGTVTTIEYGSDGMIAGTITVLS